MTGTRNLATSAIAESVVDRCAELEVRIGEAAAAIAVLSSKRAEAQPEHIPQLAAQVEYAERTWKDLKSTRFDLEEARLEEIAAEKAALYAVARDALSDAMRSTEGLDEYLRVKKTSGARFTAQSAMSASVEARNRVTLFTSKNPQDRMKLQGYLSRLRARLEQLGR